MLLRALTFGLAIAFAALCAAIALIAAYAVLTEVAPHQRSRSGATIGGTPLQGGHTVVVGTWRVRPRCLVGDIPLQGGWRCHPGGGLRVRAVPL